MENIGIAVAPVLLHLEPMPARRCHLKALLFTRDDRGNLRVHGPVSSEKAKILRCEFVLVLADSTDGKKYPDEVLAFRESAAYSGLGMRCLAFLDEVLVQGHVALRPRSEKDVLPHFLTVVFDGLAGAAHQFLTVNGDTSDNPEMM